MGELFQMDLMTQIIITLDLSLAQFCGCVQLPTNNNRMIITGEKQK